jgi:lysophospholipase L1-like esterase
MMNRKGRNVALLGTAALTSAIVVFAGANPAAAPELDELNFIAPASAVAESVALEGGVEAVTTSYTVETANAAAMEAQMAVPSMMSLARVALTETIADTPAPAPTGEQITAIGDSLMVGATDYLNELLPGISIDGRVGRPLPEGMDILGDLDSQGAVREYVVMGLATNAGVKLEQLDSIIEELGPNRTLVFVNAWGDRSWIDGGNEQLDAAAAKYPGQMVIADWHGLIAEHPEFIGPDGIHANAEGKVAYANLVLDALNAAAQIH